MFRKSLISVIAVALLAGSAVSVSTTGASASDFGDEVAPVSRHHGRNVGAGLAIGAAALILGAVAYDNEHDNRRGHKRHHRRDEFAGYDDDGECFQKPIRKYDAYYGKKVVVGYRTVCR